MSHQNEDAGGTSSSSNRPPMLNLADYTGGSNKLDAAAINNAMTSVHVKLEIDPPPCSILWKDPTYIRLREKTLKIKPAKKTGKQQKKEGKEKLPEMTLEEELEMKDRIYQKVAAYLLFRHEFRANHESAMKICRTPPILQWILIATPKCALAGSNAVLKYITARHEYYKKGGCAQLALFFLALEDFVKYSDHSLSLIEDFTFILQNNRMPWAGCLEKADGCYFYTVVEVEEWQSDDFIPDELKAEFSRDLGATGNYQTHLFASLGSIQKKN